MAKIIIKANGTLQEKAVLVEKSASSLLLKPFLFLIWVGGIISIVFLPLNFYLHKDTYTGYACIVFAIFFFYLVIRAFYRSKLLNPHFDLEELNKRLFENGEINLIEFFSFELAKAIIDLQAKDLSVKSLIVAVFNTEELEIILTRFGIGAEDMQKFVEKQNIQIDLEALSNKVLSVAKENNHHSLWAIDFFIALAGQDESLKKVCRDLKLEPEDLENIGHWYTNLKLQDEKRRFFNPDNLRLNGGFGRDWAYGFTNFLRQYSIDITESIERSGVDLEIIGREKEISQIEEALLKGTGSNAIVVGDAGVGKHSVVLGFAKKVLHGEVAPGLAHFHIFQIDTDTLFASGESLDEIVNNMGRILNEASAAGNVIIFIENIDNLFSSGQVGRVDMTQIILPYLERQGVHIIGTCDVAAYNDTILSNTALSQRLTRVSVDEPDRKSMIKILENVLPAIESKVDAIISYEAIKETVNLADKYILNLPNPEKSISLLDGAATKAVSERGTTIVLPKDIEDYISEKFALPVGEADGQEKKLLLNLEVEMHKTVIGQDEAISAIANAMRRARANISNNKKPIGSFLFLGPTGVGKTETAKSLARSYFGDKSNMIRFDMSEYQNPGDIYRLIGEARGGEVVSGNLVTAVREKPFSLLLFDELEKSDPEILNLFLQILDEGILTGADGKKVSFANTIIIGTSNAGADLIRDAVNNNIDYEQDKKILVDHLIENGIYRPEFLNRFTGIIAFSPLSLDQIGNVASLKIAELTENILANKEITLEVGDQAISELASLGFDPQMGARPMERVIQDKIENILAEKILKGELNKGDKLSISKID